MPTTRRQFIKRGAGLVTLSMVMPKMWLTEARAQGNAGRRIFVVIQLGGGNDGLNTVIPYTDSRYYSLRPSISFKDTELKDAQGNSTIISNEFGLHPELSEIKGLFDQGKVAIVKGAGYQNSSLSHFLGMDIWHTANTNGGSGDGWLGKYADQALAGKSGLSAVSIGGTLPKSFFADKVVIPSISNFTTYTYQTDQRNQGDRNNQINTFSANSSRSHPAGSFLEAIAGTGLDAVQGAAQVQSSVGQYTSPITYPENNPLAAALRMAAQLITTIPEANLLYVTLGGFDHHSQEIGNQAEPNNKLVGQHATLLSHFSEGVKAFYDDMAAHNLADKVLMMQWSEFGRRPNEDASFGTDHGTAAPMFIIGDPVQGGFYGEQPSLAVTELDQAGNLKFKVDFRAVYATILDRWLQADSESILGALYENVGFLG
jgi:uncharacterized protein (DUF1501 family)